MVATHTSDVEVYIGESYRLRHVIESWQLHVNNSDNFDLSIDAMIDTLNDLITYPLGELLVLKGPGGRALGFMGLVKIPSPIGSDSMASEKFFYVLPECRGGGLKLIRAAEKWAKANECNKFLLTSSTLADIDSDRVCNLYKKLGFRLFEQTFIKEV